MDVSIVFQQMVLMFLMMALGFFLMKRGIFSKSAPTDFSKMIADVCNPALLVFSALDDSGSVNEKDLLVAAIVAAIYFAVLLGVSYLIPYIIGVKKEEHRTYQLLGTYGNMGFMGIPLISAIMGNSAVIYLSIFIIFFNLLIYTHGINTITSEIKDGRSKSDWRRMINPGTIASVIAIILFLSRATVPTIVSEGLNYVGRCTAFLSMAVIGMVLSSIPIKELFSESKLYIFEGLRYLLLPIVVAFCLRPFIHNEILLGVTVLTLAMPAANLPLMISKQYNVEADLLAKGIVFTTLLSVISVTVASWVLA